MEQIKQKWWHKLADKTRKFLRDDKGLRYYFAALGIIIATGVGLLFLLQPPALPSLGGTFETPERPPEKFYSPLTGVEVPDEAATKQQVTAIMIENDPEARPHSGLKDSGVVFEAIAEGGITRFIALYQEQKPQLIGPVRSLRPYFLEWATPFDAAIAHVGGSANALAEVRNGNYKDIDQFFNADAYWRVDDKYAPHNLYTSFERLDALNQAKGFTNSEFTGFPRVDADKKKTPAKTKEGEDGSVKPLTAHSIDIDISYSIFNVHYDYDAENNVYLRSEGGEPHMDREAGRISPKVAIVIKVPTHIGFEDGYREQMNTNGENEAFIFQNGEVIEGKWHKPSREAQIEFLTKENESIPLERGQTWITAIPTDRNVTWQ